jgi:hypothetical protein
MRVNLATSDTSIARRLFSEIIDRVRAIPGVVDDAWASAVPLQGRGSIESVVVEGREDCSHCNPLRRAGDRDRRRRRGVHDPYVGASVDTALSRRPVAFGVAVAVLAAAALAGSYLSAKRATRVDPAIAPRRDA